MRLPVLLSLLLLALGGCNRPRLDSPVDAYTSFHRLVRSGEHAKAWAVLSQPTQQALAARAQAVAQASGGTPRGDALTFFFANVPPPPELAEVEVKLVSEGPQAAQVSVVAAASTREVRLVREPSGWKIDLTDSLPQ